MNRPLIIHFEKRFIFAEEHPGGLQEKWAFSCSKPLTKAVVCQNFVAALENPPHPLRKEIEPPSKLYVLDLKGDLLSSFDELRLYDLASYKDRVFAVGEDPYLAVISLLPSGPEFQPLNISQTLEKARYEGKFSKDFPPSEYPKPIHLAFVLGEDLILVDNLVFPYYIHIFGLRKGVPYFKRMYEYADLASPHKGDAEGDFLVFLKRTMSRAGVFDKIEIFGTNLKFYTEIVYYARDSVILEREFNPVKDVVVFHGRLFILAERGLGVLDLSPFREGRIGPSEDVSPYIKWHREVQGERLAKGYRYLIVIDKDDYEAIAVQTLMD